MPRPQPAVNASARTAATPGAPANLHGGAFRNPYLMLALASLFWSGNHVTARAFANEIPPFIMAEIRWLVPTLLIAPVAWPYVRRDWPAIRAAWPLLLFYGMTSGALFGVLQYWGLQYTTAINVSVLNSLSPVLIVAAGALLFRDRITWRQLLGITGSLAGVVVVVTRFDLGALAALELNRGDVLIVANMLNFAVYSACLRLRPDIHWLSLTFVVGVIATLAPLPLVAWEHASGFHFVVTPFTILAALYMSIFPSVVAFVCWNRGVELIGATRASPFLHLVALYSAVLATSMLGEQLKLFHIVGFTLIVGGVFLAARKP